MLGIDVIWMRYHHVHSVMIYLEVSSLLPYHRGIGIISTNRPIMVHSIDVYVSVICHAIISCLATMLCSAIMQICTNLFVMNGYVL
jgi:hypothetical protein